MKNIWIWLVVLVVIAGGGYWYWQNQQAPAMSDDGTPAATDAIDDVRGADATPVQAPGTTDGATVTASTGAPMTAAVTYDGRNFSPSEVTIKKGGTVTFNGVAGMWVASAQHPTHTGYDGTSRTQHCAAGYTGATPFDQCKQGATYSFTFDKVGTWPYHDHMNAAAFGKIVVVE